MSSSRPTVRRRAARLGVFLLALALIVGSILLPVSAQAAPVSEEEPNRSTATAQTLALGDTVSGVFGPKGDCDNDLYDCDVYRMTAPTAGRMQLDLRFSDALGTDSSFELEVLTAAGAAVYEHDVSSADHDGSTLRGLAMYVDAGVFSVSLKSRVNGFGDVWSGQSYTLSAAVVPGIVETESNRNTALADVITLGRTIEGSTFAGDCVENFDDCDFYRVSMPAATTLSVDFRFSCELGTGYPYDVAIHDNSGDVLSVTDVRAADCDGAEMRAKPISVSGGNVYVEVSSRANTITKGKPYTLTVNEVTPQYFVDVPSDHPFYDAIQWMGYSGLSTGYAVAGGREYRPVPDVSREAMAAFLYRYSGETFTPPTTPSFSDVPTTATFYTAIEWMKADGITTGYADGTFRPVDTVTREAMAAFLGRMDGVDVSDPGPPQFSDVPASNPFFGYVNWMKISGMSTGYPDGTFRPLENVTRQAMAAFLYRYDTQAR